MQRETNEKLILPKWSLLFHVVCRAWHFITKGMFTLCYMNFSTQMYLIFTSTRVQNHRRPFVSGTSWIIFNITYLILFSKTGAHNCLSVERRDCFLMCVEEDSRITVPDCLSLCKHIEAPKKTTITTSRWLWLRCEWTKLTERNKGGRRGRGPAVREAEGRCLSCLFRHKEYVESKKRWREELHFL